ncbi:MAG: photosystem II stability/assembly factor-like uncharacterized protein [Candidatus Azotimanducaceae bacterium]|jgi:photosystem II stability/assembly factor-like uncharacterized protein
MITFFTKYYWPSFLTRKYLMNNFSLAFAAIITLIVTTTIQANWESVGGPVGGIGYDVRIHPANKQIMYVTDNSAGVGISQDGGKNWAVSNAGITIKSGATGDAVNIFSLTIDSNTPTTLWAGTRGSNGEYGIFKSTDSGVNWVKKDTGIDGILTGYPNAELVFRGFTVEPGNSSVVYAMAQLDTGVTGRTFNLSKGRIFKTIDGGTSWITIWEGNNLARYLHINPTDTNVLYASTGIFDVEAFDSNCDTGVFGGEGVIKSTNGGASWNNINTDLEDPYIGSLRMHPTNSDILFAGGSANDACQGTGLDVSGLFKTTNGGQTWTRVRTGNISAVNFAPSDPDIIYAAFEDAIHRSADGGVNWITHRKPNSSRIGPVGMNMGIPIDLVVDPDDPDIVYVNNYGGGVFKSVDGGATWNIWNRGMTGSNVRNIALNNSDNSLVYAAAQSGIFKTLNYGNDWDGISNGDAISVSETSSVAIKPDDEQVIIFGADYTATLYRSTDAGITVTKVHQHAYNAGGGPNSQKYGVICFAPSNSLIVYAGVFAKNSVPNGAVISKSTDGGNSFTLISSPMEGRNIEDIYVDKVNANTVYVATSDVDPGDDINAAGLYKSTDGGINWNVVLADINIGALTEMSNGTLVAGSLWGAAASGIYLSSNLGLSWSGPFTNGIGMEPYIRSLAVSPDGLTVYAAEGFSGVFSSTDGQTWVSDMVGLGFKDVHKLKSNDHALFAATAGGGVYRYFIDQSDISPNDFSFSPSENVSLNTQIESNAITVSGISGAASISIVGGQYSINGSTFSNNNNLISVGDSLVIQVMSSSQYSMDSSTTVTVGDLSRTFSVSTIAAPDTSPNDFSFVASINVALDSLITSESITVSGVTSAVPISITGGQYSINDAAFSDNNNLISAGDSLVIQVMSSSQYATDSFTTVTVGDLSRTFSVSTIAAPDTKPATSSTSEGGSGSMKVGWLLLLLGLMGMAQMTVRKKHYSLV